MNYRLISNYTYGDYSQWEGRWELIEGLPIAMSPAPSLNHQWVTANIIGELRTEIKKNGYPDCEVNDFIDLKISETTVVQPDCSVVCDSVSGNFLSIPPNLAVEVLSVKTAMKDRHTKFGIYEKFGIKYYMLMEPNKKEIEIS